MPHTKRIAHVSYDGTDYHGFSISPGKSTIQETIEEVLSKIIDDTSGSSHIDFTSRTDRGVHAMDQVITFFMPDFFDDQKLLFILNQRLPSDIRFQQLSTVPDSYLLRDKILTKLYRYTLSNDCKNPFMSRYAWLVPVLPEIEKLNSFLQLMTGEHDFLTLAKESSRYQSTVCRIDRIDCHQKSLSELIVTIEGNRFLYNMVRRIVGFTVFLAKNHKTVSSSFEELTSLYLSQTNMRAPACGLTLLKVFLDDN